MALSIFAEFFRPIIKSCMEHPEDRREAERAYLRTVEDKAMKYVNWFRTSNKMKPEYTTAVDIGRYFEESAADTKYTPGRRHPDYSLDEKAPWTFNRRY